jgi:hypothetical protein
VTAKELDELRECIAECGCGDGECDGWGCASVECLLDEIDRLRAELAEVTADRDELLLRLKEGQW